MKNNRYVFDTNTLVSAFLFKHSVPRKAFDEARRMGRICGNTASFLELGEVLLRPKFDKYISAEKRLTVLKEIKELLFFIEVTEIITDCRDPKDNKFLELAVTANASCIVTGDQDLLVLHPFRNIPILNAVGFINAFPK